jgi:hypothetical protein
MSASLIWHESIPINVFLPCVNMGRLCKLRTVRKCWMGKCSPVPLICISILPLIFSSVGISTLLSITTIALTLSLLHFIPHKSYLVVLIGVPGLAAIGGLFTYVARPRFYHLPGSVDV